ncbi:MAG: nicotinate-nicotinamide nucleotide adenylyltransferase, partial [Candidatus Saccharimonadales bacterium]
IIARCLAVPGVDEVWLVPSGNRTDKNIAVTAADQLAMLKIVVKNVCNAEKRLRIVDTELKRGIATETYDTYQEFLRDYPETDFWFVYGSDSYATIRHWLNGDWLSRNLPVMLVPRNGATLPAAAKHILHVPGLPGALAPISSTAVRQKVTQKEAISSLVPTAVADYIKTHALFR